LNSCTNATAIEASSIECAEHTVSGAAPPFGTVH
jgi:hypothetical protein